MWVMLLPATREDGTLFTNDGRGPWTVDVSAVISAFHNDRTGLDGAPRPLPFDVQHETERHDKDGEAKGWIIDLAEREDGSIHGRVEWTDVGRRLIESGAFKFVSPVIFVLRQADGPGVVIRIKNAALTNNPNLNDMPALNDAGEPAPTREDDQMSKMQELAVALGLDATANGDLILSACRTRLGLPATTPLAGVVEAATNASGLLNTIGLTVSSTQAEAVAALTTDTSGTVTTVELATALGRPVSETKDDLLEACRGSAKRTTENIEALVSAAVNRGSVTPAKGKVFARAANAMERDEPGSGFSWLSEAIGEASPLTAAKNKPKGAESVASDVDENLSKLLGTKPEDVQAERLRRMEVV